MQKFDLSLWLQDKSRKVVTRDGRPVRIICTDRKGRSGNIVGLVGEDESFIYVWNNDGKHIVSEIPDNDLFFADEEEELTEFEKRIYNLINFSDQDNCPSIKEVKEEAEILLDLARKELQPEFDKELDKAYKTQDDVVYRNGYAQGKQDALKAILDSLTDKEKIIKEPFEFPSFGQNDCYHGGPCTNPHYDCINCPRVFGDGTTITRTNMEVRNERYKKGGEK